jgi:hypothetical protein
MYYITIDFPSGLKKFTYKDGDGAILNISDSRRSLSIDENTQNQVITITFDNTKGYWYSIMNTTDRALLDRELKRYTLSGVLIDTFRISSFPPADTPVQFKIKADTQTSLAGPISAKITRSLYPNIGDNDGKYYGNIVCGVCSDADWKAIGMLPAVKVDTGKFHAAWHHLKAVSTVYLEDGTPVSSYTVDNNADGCCYIMTSETAGVIYFNCQGMADQGGVLIYNPVYQFQAINDQFLGFNLTGVADAAALAASRGYTNSVIVINTEYSLKQFCKDLFVNYDMLIYMTADGGLAVKVQNWIDVTPVAKITATSIQTYALNLNTDNICTQYSCLYRYHWRDQELKQSTTVSTTSLWPSRSDNLQFYFHLDDSTAQDRAARLLFLRRDFIEEITFILLRKDVSFDLGDYITVNYPLSMHPGENRVCQVLEMLEAREDLFTVKAVDVDQINQRQIILRAYGDSRSAHLKADNDPEIHLLI